MCHITLIVSDEEVNSDLLLFKLSSLSTLLLLILLLLFESGVSLFTITFFDAHAREFLARTPLRGLQY
jgi:hypothetical protein